MVGWRVWGDGSASLRRAVNGHGKDALDRIATQDTTLGLVLGGNYRIDALLDSGAMGTVYRALQLDVGRPVAVKVISEALASHPECVGRFRREAAAMARLQHPNTVRLLETGSEGRRLYLVMELLEGEDLSKVLARRGRLGELRALDILRQVLGALQEAHGLGIIHRDVKPGNVFLSRASGGGVIARLLDFGVAGGEHARGSTLTMRGSVLGTPSYMSPEQAQGMTVDARTDLYAAGLMLFEMVTGQMPFAGDSSVAMLLAQLMQPTPRLADVAPDRPTLVALQPLLDTLLAKDPTARPTSAEKTVEMITTLEVRLRSSAPSVGGSGMPSG